VNWRDMFRQTGVGLAADGNGNVIIDAGDFNVGKTNFGHTAGSGSGARVDAIVPEPATVALLIVGMLAISSRPSVIVS
jgi:hypothetical protein